MVKFLASCRKWVSLRILESCRWQDSPYLPNVTYRRILSWCVQGILCQVLLCYFFYNNWIAFPFLVPVSAVLVYRQWNCWKERVLLDIEVGFKDWLYYVKGGLSSGKSVEHAVLSCRESFEACVGAGHPILLGLEQVYRGLGLHIPIEECIRRFGEETRVEVIQDFAVVFDIAKKQGGHMAATLERTIQQIYERIDLRMEIHAMISAKKMEQRIMCVMPFGIMFFVGRASGGYFMSLYHNMPGVLIMSACMCLYLVGVWWGEKLTEVQL